MKFLRLLLIPLALATVQSCSQENGSGSEAISLESPSGGFAISLKEL